MSGGPRPDTWMPLYIGDYLGDTMRLSHAQHGIYLLLIMAYWRNGGPLLDDAGELAATAKCSGPEWKKNLPVISRFFHIEGGAWSHKRIDAELAWANRRTEERSRAGSEGARRRWQTDGKAMAEPMANASQTDGTTRARLPSPSPSPEEEEDSEATPLRAEPLAAYYISDLWNRGLQILGGDQRRLLGKMRKDHGDEAVLAAIVACEAEHPAEPASFFIACVARAPPKNGHGKQSPVTTLYEGAMRAADKLDREERDRRFSGAAIVPLLDRG